MKINSGQLEAMRIMIAPLDTIERRAAYRAGEFPRADRVKDLDTRYRWDLFYAARIHGVVPGKDRTITSDHIDTALRRIVPAL